jgi:hypothetical protein
MLKTSATASNSHGPVGVHVGCFVEVAGGIPQHLSWSFEEEKTRRGFERREKEKQLRRQEKARKKMAQADSNAKELLIKEFLVMASSDDDDGRYLRNMNLCINFLDLAWKDSSALFEGTVNNTTSLQQMKKMAQKFKYWKSRLSMLLLCDTWRLFAAADEAENLTINKTPSDELTDKSAINDATIALSSDSSEDDGNNDSRMDDAGLAILDGVTKALDYPSS